MAWAIARIFGLIFLIASINAYKVPKIIGGNDANVKQFPFIVSLRDRDGDHFCAGSIISDRHILTAAHCVDEEVERIIVHSGTSRADKPGNLHKVISKTVHPTYDKRIEVSTSDDLAVLELAEPIVFNKYQQKINLPTRDVEEYEVGYAIGWGRTSTSSYWETATQLQKLRVALLPSKKCQPFLTHAIIDEKQICAVRNVEKSVCHGDSGGPLVTRGEIVGIVSRGNTGNCAVGIPDIFTNVFAHKDFIESAMKD